MLWALAYFIVSALFVTRLAEGHTDNKRKCSVDELFKKLLGIAGYLFAGLLIAFTATQTYALLYEVSNSHLTAAIGLVLFEGGMIYWWSVFRREAAGLFQMAISFLMFVLGLVLVTMAVALHLGAVDVTFLGPETPARIVIIATVINLIAKLAFPLVDPDVFTVITERAHEGKILSRTYARFETKIDDIAEDLSNDMADMWTERTRARTLANWEGGLNKRKLPAGTVAKDGLEVSSNGHKGNPTGGR